MDRALAIAPVVGLMTLWGVYLHKTSGGRMVTRPWIVFAILLVGMLYVLGLQAWHIRLR